MRQVMIELEPRFERATGHTLEVTFDASGTITKRIERGEKTDVVMLARDALDRLVEDCRLVPGSEVDLALSVAGVAVRRGATKPDISTPAAFRSALIEAKTIARPDPALGGASGMHIAKVLERLGIAEQVIAKSVIVSTPGDERTMPGWLVADGRAEIALHQVQELLAIPGIELVGPFPAELEETFVFSAGILASSSRAAAARQLLDFLRTPEAMAVIRAKGMRIPSQRTGS